MEGETANLKNFKVFGSKCYIKRKDWKIGKFDSRVDKGIFIGYPHKTKDYRCYNLRLNWIIETINVTFDEVHGPKVKQGSSSPNEPDLKEA